MSDETFVPDPPENRRNDALFFGFVAILMIAIFGGAAYLLGAFGGSKDDVTPVAPAPHRTSKPPSGTGHGAAQSRAAALAVVEKNFRLALSGNHRAACALESPAYLRFDARNYSQGSCEAGSKALAEQLAAQGLSMTMTRAKVKSFAGGAATIAVSVTVGAKHVSERVYVQYHAGKWWITGADDSGDLGYQ